MPVLPRRRICPFLLPRVDAISSSSSSVPARSTSSLAPKMKSADLAYYWGCVMRAEEDALQGTRPWQRLEFVPVHDPKLIVPSVKGERLHKDYAFGKSVDSAAIEQLKSTTVMNATSLVSLHYPFGPSIQPRGIEPSGWREAFERASLHLLGVVHNRPACKLRVERLIGAVQPDMVMLELDRSRLWHLMGEEELEAKIGQPFSEYLDGELAKFDKLAAEGNKYADLGWFMRRKCRRDIRKEFDTLQADYHQMRNAETRAALAACRGVPGCAGLILGDLQFRQASEALLEMRRRNRRKWRRVFHERTLEEVEAAANGEFNQCVLVDRDRHMVRVLHTLLHRLTIEKLWTGQRMGVDFEPVRVVAVVGMAHVKGIAGKWARPEEVYGLEEKQGEEEGRNGT